MAFVRYYHARFLVVRHRKQVKAAHYRIFALARRPKHRRSRHFAVLKNGEIVVFV